jgi:flagellar biosynthesis protein FlhB
VAGDDAGSAQATHEPTARRLADARRAGLVAHSADLRGALALAATGVTLALLAPSIAGQLVVGFATGLRRASQGESLSAAAARGLDTGARVLAVPLAVALVVTLIAGLLQTGALWVAGPRPDVHGRSSLGRLRRVWGGAAFGAALVGLAKVALVAGVAALALGALVPRLILLAGVPAPHALAAFGAAARSLGARVLVSLLAIGAADYAWVRWRHLRALRMTSRQIERERREREGDPLPRAERRRLHGALAAGATPAEAARAAGAAGVIVYGGGAGAHACVAALAYQPGGARAPVVVARARGAACAPLLVSARAAGVPVIDDGALASALVELEAGNEIPASMYEQVAQAFREVPGLGAAGIGAPPMPHGASRAAN